jgi:hypothetical protein
MEGKGLMNLISRVFQVRAQSSPVKREFHHA